MKSIILICALLVATSYAQVQDTCTKEVIAACTGPSGSDGKN